MAQSGYTPIITYYSNTTGNTPTSISLGELAVNVMDSKLFIGTGTNTFKTLVNPAGTTSITTLGTITTGVWNGTAIGNTYLANSTISGVSLGSNLANLTAGTNISFSSGTTYNGSSAITINATASPQVYPSAGIANSTGTAWGTSYSTTGSGTVVALATSPTFVTPILGTPTSGTLTNTTGFPAANLAGTALPSAIVTSSLTAVGTIATGVWNGTTIAIANGGTGQTTASAGFNALSPITTTGDLIIGNGTNSATRLAIGANTYVLTSNGTTASWVAPSGGSGTVNSGTQYQLGYYATTGTAISGNSGIVTNATGFLGINTTAAASGNADIRLAVKGISASNNVCEVQVSTNGTDAFDFRSSSGNQSGYIRVNGGTVTYNSVSDYRLKNTILPLTGALAKVALLKPCTYKWNEDNSECEGFIAHELAKVCPQAVSGAKDELDKDGNPRYQGVDTSFLVATLTAAIQEQQVLIDALNNRISLIENKTV